MGRRDDTVGMRAVSAVLALLVLLAGCSGSTVPDGRSDASTVGSVSTTATPSPTPEGTVATPTFPAAVTNQSAVRYVERLQLARSHDDAVDGGAYRVEGGCDGWLVGVRDGVRYVHVGCGIATYYRDGSHGDGFVRAVYRVDSTGATRTGDGPHRRVDVGESDRPTTVTAFSLAYEDVPVRFGWRADDGTVVRRANATVPGGGALFVSGLPSPTNVPAHWLFLAADGAETTVRVPATERHVVVVITPDGPPVVGFDE